MALVRSEIGTWAEKTGDSTLVSSSFTPPDNSVLLVFCATMNSKAGPLSSAPTMSNSGTALTFTPIGTTYGDASWAIRMDVYRVLVTSHAAMTVTFLENNGGIAGQAMAIIAYTGHDTTTPIAGFVGSGNTDIGNGSETQTLTIAPTTDDVTIYCLNEDCDGNPANPTMALGWNKIYDFAADAGYGQLIIARRESSTSTSVTCDDTYTAAGNFYKGSMMSFIVKVAGGAITKSLTDTGTGADSKPTISASLSRSDGGVGTDVKPTLSASLSRSDVGTGVDSRTLSASLSRTDASHGSDSISPPSASLSLPERGVANERSALSASVSKSDVGSGIDNPASLSSLGMSDGALGGDFLDLSALDIINEIGSGSDTLSGLLASLGVTENISGSDLLQLLASLSLSDTGSGSDTINILTALIVAIQDAASGIDGLSIAASLSIIDIGDGQEGLSIQVSISVVDTATGIDIESVIKALISAISVADGALGTDGLIISASLNVPEPAYGLDDPTIAALITGYDISITSDSPQIQASLSVIDTSSATDGLSILQSILKLVQDLASGNDFVGSISANIPVSELGLGTDKIGQLLASLMVTDFGTGVEVITTINITTQIIKISFIIKKSAIAFAFAQSQMEFSIANEKKKSIEFEFRCPMIEFSLRTEQMAFSFLDGG